MASTRIGLRQLIQLAAGTVFGNAGTATADPAPINVPIWLTSFTAANQANLPCDFSSWITLYKTIQIRMSGFQPITAGSRIIMRLSKDAISYDSAAASYNWGLEGMLDGAQTTTGNASDTSIQIGGASGIGNSSGRCLNAVIEIDNVNVSTFNPSVRVVSGNSVNNSGNCFSFQGGGFRLAAQITKAVQFLTSSGNLSVGTADFWGIK